MRVTRVLTAIAFAFLVLSAWSQPPAKTAKYTIFSAPNAGTGSNQGTYAMGITSNGTVGGYYVDANNLNHGFIRSPDGKTTVVDVPQAGTDPGQGTRIIAMNSSREATGWYGDANGVMHGFLRSPQGRITLFDPSGSQLTYANEINDAGTVAGVYLDEVGFFRVFLRSRSGEITTYDMPGARQNGWNTNSPDWSGINKAGALISVSWDESGGMHGWIRSPQGLVNELPSPLPGGIYPWGINPQGAMTGIALDENFTARGFFRDVHGNYTLFDAPGSENGGGTGPENLNASNTITGNFWDPTGNNHGFIRAADGTFTVFDMPGAGKGNYQGTLPTYINAQGWITGTIVDDNFFTKSFVMIP